MNVQENQTQQIYRIYKKGAINIIKRIFKKFTAVILAAVLAVAGTGTNTLAEKAKKDYLALGDSITRGYGLENQADSFTEIVAKSLDMSLQNLAVNGDTSADLLKIVSDKGNKKAIENADLITISIGGNDLLHVLYKLIRQTAGLSDNVTFTELQEALLNVENLIPKIGEMLEKLENIALFEKAISEYALNLEKIFSKIKEINPKVEILFLNLYNPLSGAPVFRRISNSAQKIINSMNEQTANVVAKFSDKNIKVVDVAKAFDNRGLILTNILYLDVHPNKAGNKVIAQSILNLV